MDVPIAANVLGTFGAVCWSIQLIPQIVINARRKDTTGLQPSMMLLWACAGVPLGAYNVSENFNIALQIQPQILTVLSLITWGQCRFYGSKRSLTKCLTLLLLMGVIFGGIETALIFALRVAHNKHLSWPTTLMGILSTVLLSAGVLRHYWDIYIHHTVRGISFIFVGIDAAGDVFSLVSVFFQPSLDILGIVIYTTEFVLWCGVFACGAWFNLRPYLVSKLAKRSESRRLEAIYVNDINLQHVSRNLTESGSRDGGLGGEEIAFDERLRRLGSSTSVFRTSGSFIEGSERDKVVSGGDQRLRERRMAGSSSVSMK